MTCRDSLSLHFLVGIMSSNNVSFTVYKIRANCDCISAVCYLREFQRGWIVCWCIWYLTPCRRVTRKLLIALPCVVDGPRVSSFSYMMSCTCICQLVWLTYHFKVINSLMQDALVSSYKQTGPDPLFLEPEDCNKESTHSDTLSVFLQLQLWLCIRMFCKRTMFCVSYMRIHVLISLIIVTMKVWTVTVTSLQLVYVNIAIFCRSCY